MLKGKTRLELPLKGWSGYCPNTPPPPTIRPAYSLAFSGVLQVKRPRGIDVMPAIVCHLLVIPATALLSGCLFEVCAISKHMHCSDIVHSLQRRSGTSTHKRSVFYMPHVSKTRMRGEMVHLGTQGDKTNEASIRESSPGLFLEAPFLQDRLDKAVSGQVFVECTRTG